MRRNRTRRRKRRSVWGRRIGGDERVCFNERARPRHTGLMPVSDRIVVDPEVLAGKPLIRGTRLAVELVLELLAAGQSENQILANYPGLTRDDIACLAYA